MYQKTKPRPLKLTSVAMRQMREIGAALFPNIHSSMKIAILVDGGFYRKRAKILWKKENKQDPSGEERAKELEAYCLLHVKTSEAKDNHNFPADLYRIFYYDCPPAKGSVYHPFLKKNENLEKTDVYKWTTAFFDAIKKQRKFALRLGKLATPKAYELKPNAAKDLLNRTRAIDELKKVDFRLATEQKGVDMRIGLDIASLAYKHLVDQIILIAGDSDFVPAAKLARREGIDFILDPMGQGVTPDLSEHIDDLRTLTGEFSFFFKNLKTEISVTD